MPPTTHDDVRRRLEALPADVLARLAAEYGRDVDARGLHVVRGADGGPVSRVAIPPLLTPVAPDSKAAPAAHALLASVIAVARALFTKKLPMPRGLLTGLTPFEKRCIDAGWADAERVASARVDFLHDDAGRLRALEVNTTIPAMQGYSDVVAAGFVRHVGAALGASPERVARAIALLPSNADDLRRSLLSHASETGAGRAGRWAMLARANDAQEGDLGAIAARWRDAGIDPVRVTPDDFFARGPFDLVYRHLFARRLPAGHALEAVYATPRKSAMWNPVNGHLEIKGMLALASAAMSDPAIARAIELPDDFELARETLPWTRLLLAGRATGPDDAPIRDLPAWVAAHPESLIVKRSWDYGGRSVFMAEDFAGGANARIEAAAGRPLATWEELARFAADDPAGDWIVQERIRPRRARHLRVVDGEPEWAELVTDLSAYTGHGAAFHPTGLTSRASGSLVVNIVSGGGMAPVIAPEVLAALFE